MPPPFRYQASPALRASGSFEGLGEPVVETGTIFPATNATIYSVKGEKSTLHPEPALEAHQYVQPAQLWEFYIQIYIIKVNIICILESYCST